MGGEGLLCVVDGELVFQLPPNGCIKEELALY